MKNTKQVYQTFIRSTPKKTWDAITKPEFARQYWAGIGNVSDWKKGSKWEHIAEGKDVWITGKVMESIPPKRLVITWADPDDLKDKSRVTFEIEPIKDLVCLTVTHDKFKDGSKMAGKVSWGLAACAFEHEVIPRNGKGLERLRQILN